MSRIEDQLTEQFYRWELRGRGWQVFEQPVGLEPPFLPFAGHFLPRRDAAYEGRRHTAASGFLARLRQTVAPPPEPEEPGASCTHGLCTNGAKLDAACDPCATTVCAADAYCCRTKWDSQCVSEVNSICGETCQ